MPPTSEPPVKLVPYRELCREDTIELLKKALQEAEAGEIEQVAIAFVRRTGAINTAFSLGEAGILLGATTLLMHRLARSVE